MATPNYYAENPLNRLSYLRTSSAFLASALSSPKAKFLLYDNLNPLAAPPASDGSIKLHTVSWDDVKEYVGEAKDVFVGVDGKEEKYHGEVSGFWTGKEKEGKDKGTLTAEEKRAHFLNQPALVFLGVLEPPHARSLPTEKPTDASTLDSHSPDGIPHFALDVTTLTELKGKFKSEAKFEFVDMRTGMSTIPGEEAALGAEGRALIDWNKRNLFCPACSRPMKSVWAGWKKACIPGEPAASGVEASPPCISKKGVHNFNYPRTDPVVIMAVLDPSREKILLGRQRVWPKKFYSCLAGFIEPGETIEEAVKREVYEEAGVELEEVYYHSSQPWPYPSSLMIGCIGIAKPDQKIRLDLDNELEDARYFSRDSVLAVIRGGKGHGLTREEVSRIDGKEGATEAKDEKVGAESADWFRMPPATAIANTLISAWAKNTYLQAPGAGSSSGNGAGKL